MYLVTGVGIQYKEGVVPTRVSGLVLWDVALSKVVNLTRPKPHTSDPSPQTSFHFDVSLMNPATSFLNFSNEGWWMYIMWPAS